ncbi:MAG TPA: hypothetical protein VFA07_16030 [Chthonomonadaceae bacterium]|nr:hypothetical protein [Chthonomonadaceae bacterium]
MMPQLERLLYHLSPLDAALGFYVLYAACIFVLMAMHANVGGVILWLKHLFSWLPLFTLACFISFCIWQPVAIETGILLVMLGATAVSAALGLWYHHHDGWKEIERGKALFPMLYWTQIILMAGAGGIALVQALTRSDNSPGIAMVAISIVVLLVVEYSVGWLGYRLMQDLREKLNKLDVAHKAYIDAIEIEHQKKDVEVAAIKAAMTLLESTWQVGNDLNRLQADTKASYSNLSNEQRAQPVSDVAAIMSENVAASLRNKPYPAAVTKVTELAVDKLAILIGISREETVKQVRECCYRLADCIGGNFQNAIGAAERVVEIYMQTYTRRPSDGEIHSSGGSAGDPAASRDGRVRA